MGFGLTAAFFLHHRYILRCTRLEKKKTEEEAKRAKQADEEAAQNRLRKLTDAEKYILKAYVATKTRSVDQLFNTNAAGHLNELVHARVLRQTGVIRRPNPNVVEWAACEYNIEAWAYDFLTAHPELVGLNEAESIIREIVNTMS